MWSVESTVIVPIVVSVNGLLVKSFDQHLKKLSLGCWIKGRIQKAVVLETALIVKRFHTLETRKPAAWALGKSSLEQCPWLKSHAVEAKAGSTSCRFHQQGPLLQLQRPASVFERKVFAEALQAGTASD
ncbi:jg14957 [Pararge aegeria aegeria]|uniref:Jg14957 protein n=1 Tax=Pararge aegeria aegeria TaxID=348720 RepID=A0A8S4SJE0_9NEOP|nr:jg14957 [Pararge aegeria aegeria]